MAVSLSDRLQSLVDEVADLERDLAEEYSRAAGLEEDVQVLEAEVSDLREAVAALEEEVAGEDA